LELFSISFAILLRESIYCVRIRFVKKSTKLHSIALRITVNHPRRRMRVMICFISRAAALAWMTTTTETIAPSLLIHREVGINTLWIFDHLLKKWHRQWYIIKVGHGVLPVHYSTLSSLLTITQTTGRRRFHHWRTSLHLSRSLFDTRYTNRFQ